MIKKRKLFYRINYLYILEKVVQNFQKQNVPEMSYNYKKHQTSHFDPLGSSSVKVYVAIRIQRIYARNT